MNPAKQDKQDSNLDPMVQPQATSESVIDAVQAEANSAEALAQAQAEITKLQAELAAAQAKVEENRDLYIRGQAEADNQRRRYEKQVEDAHKFSVQRFAEALLPVADSLEMGLQAQGDADSLRQGMELTLKQFESVMEKFKMEAVNPLGQPFNPEQHQAVGMQPHPDYDNNTVSLVMQKGYTLSGRTIRPAMVMVSKK
ncbi:nucleotide exchange factor GrpE [uncultured Thiothrix sp.]|jgi:molecular chaperone GrpE|uniref:nucleotide exchange factor GrpE n=1 Tax=uncultured Thiothrix sp. TaxID=223185 RepID=UPI00263018B6|nr:nucleotide exchange factor GrpE [uncultured Thiothrix sp.]HMT94893.1 nucleotide exchange factor GrpE [Thiolinea sp.]